MLSRRLKVGRSFLAIVMVLSLPTVGKTEERAGEKEWAGVPGSMSLGSGHVGLMNKAPHPNATRLFINWIASKEGLEIYSQTQTAATTRTDVEELNLGVSR